MEQAKPKSNVKLFAIIGAAVALVAGIAIALILLLGNKNKLIGQWVYERGGWEYNFVSDTAGEYGLSDSSYVSKFTYKDNGDSFTYSYEGSDAENTLNYRIEDNKLIVTDNFGNDTVYIRK